MSDTSKSVWIGAGFAVVIVLLGATLWKITQSPNGAIAKRLSAIDSKLESASAALAKTQTASSAVAINQRLGRIDAKIAKIDAALNSKRSLDGIGKKLDALNAGIDGTKAALAALENKTSLSGIGKKLDALNAGIDSTKAALAGIQKAIPTKGVSDKLDAIAASLNSADGKLAQIKQAIPPQATGDFEKAAAQFKSINATLTKLQQARSEGGGKADALDDAVGDLKKNIDEAAALRTKLADAIGRLDDAVKAAAKPKPSEVVVVYLDLPDKSRLPHTVATVSPLQIQFKQIGSANDDGQAAMIVAKLKDIVKDRKGCTISVAGFADTLGGDRTNLTLSKKRAQAIAAKLKTAFAGQPVQINESAWGERRLADWTPDETGDKANRRVDVAVSCKE